MAEDVKQLVSVVAQYTAALEEEGVDFEINEAGNALLVFGDTIAGRCEGYIVVDEFLASQMGEEFEPLDLAFCEVFFVLPLDNLHGTDGTASGSVGQAEGDDDDVSSLQNPVLHELVLRLNESHRIGSYELHIEENELRFRIYQTFGTSSPVSRDQLLMPLYEAVRAIDLHWEFFAMVLTEGLDPAHAVAEFYARESLPGKETVGINEELIQRAGELFEVARKRYRNAKRLDRADAVTKRLTRLTVEAGQAVARAMGV